MVEEKISNLSNKGRVAWVDIAKGIAILLVIIGHSISSGFYGSTLRGLIFSFHMPLFFILSCVTYKMSTDDFNLREKTKKAFKHLIGPALFTFAMIIIWQCLNDKSLINVDYWKGKLYTLILTNGVTVEFNGMEVTAIGIPWFFFALFIGRTMFDFCHLSVKDDKKFLILSVVLGMIGVFWGTVQWLPFSIDIALAIQPFFYWGYFLKNRSIEKHAWKKMLVWCIIWLTTLYLVFPNYNSRTYLELATRNYNLFPICYITAIAGTMFVSEFSACIGQFKIVAAPLMFLGKNSLYLLCVHILDEIYSNLWVVENHQFLTAIKRTFVDLLFFAVFMCIRYFALKVIRNINEKKRNADT